MRRGRIQCPCIASECFTHTQTHVAKVQILFYRFNSIRASPVYGFRRKAKDDIQFVCFKTRETVEECLQFWGLKQNEIVEL